MIFEPAPLAGTYVVGLEPFSDERGWFARFFCKNEFLQIGHHQEWVQMNHSQTLEKGTLRGMHFQFPPHGEVKLVRCISGAVYDVVIDLRRGSSSFLNWFGIELSAANNKMLYIPEGFAHGFQSLQDDCGLIYMHTQFYSPQVEGGIRYNDPLLGINWPLPISQISQRDAGHPFLDEKFKGI
jgi:dTDP-4-dehydrorhamnose 3,5-epimerase